MSDAFDASAPLDRGQLQQRAIKGAMWTAAHTVVSLPLAFGVNILIARVLGVQGYGRLAYLSTVITIASVIAAMGVTNALIQFGAKEHAKNRPEVVQQYLSGAQGFRLLVTGPLVAVAVLAFVDVQPWLLTIALLFGVGAPALLGTARDALVIENRTHRTAQLTMIGNAVTQVVVVLALLTLGTPDAVWSARVIASGALLALPLMSISRRYRRAVLKPGKPWRLSKAFWGFAIPTGAAGIIGALSSNRIEVVLLERLADPFAMGIFGLAFGLAGHVYAPALALMAPLLPAVSALAEVDDGAVRRAFLRTSRVASSVGGGVLVAALPTLALLVPLLYGEDFRAARDHVVMLGVVSGYTLIGSPHNAFLMARLGGRRELWISVAALLANIGLGLLLIPAIGVWGATASFCAAALVRTSLVSVGEARALRVSSVELLLNILPILIGTFVSATVWAVVRSMEAPAYLLAPVSGVVGIAAYLAIVRILGSGISAPDLEAIMIGLPKRLAYPARSMLRLLAHFEEVRI